MALGTTKEHDGESECRNRRTRNDRLARAAIAAQLLVAMGNRDISAGTVRREFYDMLCTVEEYVTNGYVTNG